MYGLVFEKLEAFVLEHHGKDAWHAVKERAGCTLEDGQFLRRLYYPDQQLVSLVVAASELINTPVPEVLEAFGHFWYRQMHDNDGHATLLQANGKTLRTWLSNLNAMHDYIQRSFGMDDFQAPVFWCEDFEDQGDILLHYYSMRGSLLVPFVEGIIKEIASCQFNVEISMELVAVQGDNRAEFTTWKVAAVDPSQRHKLTPNMAQPEQSTFDRELNGITKCPFSGKELNRATTRHGEDDEEDDPVPRIAPSVVNNHGSSLPLSSDISVSLTHMQQWFPFHILVDHGFIIRQVGCRLAPLLVSDGNPKLLLGEHIGDVVSISRPVMGAAWD